MAMVFHNSEFDRWNDLVDLSTSTVFPPPSLEPEVPPVAGRVSKGRKRRQSSITSGADGSKDASRMLACLSCRQQKIKCSRKTLPCDRCERLQIQCVVPEEDERSRPSSKSHIRDLEKQILSLQKQLRETELRAHRNLYLTPPTSSEVSVDDMGPTLGNDFEESVDAFDTRSRKTSHPLIASLCAEKPHFREDESGRVRYYGPTSSLHTSEKPACNFIRWDDGSVDPDDHQNDISPTLRDHLLDRYWRFQHQVLQIVHREAFLQDMQAGRSHYYSKALLYAILANSAVSSEVPEIRALVLSRDEDPEGSKPYLLRRAAEMTEHEIENNVGVTTVQSLQLLSAVYSRRGADTKGWLESGRASRLIYELGLHKDDAELQASRLSTMDLEVRRAVFWGSFAYDRGWGLYLGRPCALHLDHVPISTPSVLPDSTSSSSSADLHILLAWATLFTIVGEICTALNKRTFNNHHLQTYRQKLLAWESSLDPGLRHTPGCAPGVYVLQLQFHAAVTLLHRSNARFGTNQAELGPTARASRDICIEHVLHISRLLADYRTSHGSAITLMGTAMYNITVAAVVLIAIRAEQSSEASNEYLASLTTCIAALEEIQFSHCSAKTVLKQLRYLMRRCKLLNTKEDSQALRDANHSLLPRLPTMTEMESPPILLQHLVGPPDWSSDATMFMDPSQFMLALDDCEALKTMGSWNDKLYS